MNYRECFLLFTKKYKIQTSKEYFYSKSKLGLELLKIKRLKLEPAEFTKFIDWLFVKKKLASINFLPGQLNDYFSSVEYQQSLELENLLLHYKIMMIKKSIVGECNICKGIGKINNKLCKCMVKFMKIRNKIRGIKCN